MARRGLQVVLLAAGLAGLFAPIAAVATSRPPTVERSGARAVSIPSAVIKTNWWYDDPLALVLGPVTTPPATPTTVPKDDLGVGYRSGPPANALPVPVAYPAAESDKQALVSVDLKGVPAGATVTAFSFKVAVDTAGDPVSKVLLLNPAGPPVLIACPVVRDWDPGAGPARWDSLPASDCAMPVKGTFDAASSSYTFTSTALAQGWLDDVNDGLAIMADPKTTVAFTLSLAGASQMKVQLAVDVPAAPASTPEPRTSAPVSATNPSTVSIPPVTGGGFVPPVDVVGVTPPEQAAPAPVTAPQIAPGAGAGAVPTVTTAPVALSTVTGEPLWVWIVGGIGTAFLLAALSLSLGAPPGASSARSAIPLRGAAR